MKQKCAPGYLYALAETGTQLEWVYKMPLWHLTEAIAKCLCFNMKCSVDSCIAPALLFLVKRCRSAVPEVCHSICRSDSGSHTPTA